MPTAAPLGRTMLITAGESGVHVTMDANLPQPKPASTTTDEHIPESYVRDIQALCTAHGDLWASFTPTALRAISVPMPTTTGRAAVLVRGGMTHAHGLRHATSPSAKAALYVKVWGSNLHAMTAATVLFYFEDQPPISVKVPGSATSRENRFWGFHEWHYVCEVRVARLTTSWRAAVHLQHAFGELPVLGATLQVSMPRCSDVVQVQATPSVRSPSPNW